MPTVRDGSREIDYEQIFVFHAEVVVVDILREELYPFDDELEYFFHELINLFKILIRGLSGKSKQRVDVDEELASNELGAIECRLEAQEITLPYFDNLIFYLGLIIVI
jgi:hypothetical protein